MSKDIPQPQPTDDMVCPLCKAPLNGYEFWFWNKKRDLPKMVYNAITLLTKDKDGNFIWIPYEVVMDEDKEKE